MRKQLIWSKVITKLKQLMCHVANNYYIVVSHHRGESALSDIHALCIGKASVWQCMPIAMLQLI